MVGLRMFHFVEGLRFDEGLLGGSITIECDLFSSFFLSYSHHWDSGRMVRGWLLCLLLGAS